MLDLKWDKMKSQTQIRKDLGKTCTIPGCAQPLSVMSGPGSSIYCRDHQLKSKDYGGLGKPGNPWTFHRTFTCSACNRDMGDDIRAKYPGIEQSNPDLFNRLCRNRLVADHKLRRADGGEDTEENIQTLCQNCNSDKTVMEEDYLPSKFKRSKD
jgi:5-methylcytosine-specific restriction endonuclease McrA